MADNDHDVKYVNVVYIYVDHLEYDHVVDVEYEHLEHHDQLYIFNHNGLTP